MAPYPYSLRYFALQAQPRGIGGASPEIIYIFRSDSVIAEQLTRMYYIWVEPYLRGPSCQIWQDIVSGTHIGLVSLEIDSKT
eukprot:2398642-Prymnesium_polylepis.1